ncbi:MAG: hypothetical protein IPK81_16920 [Rhodospirillales bacterium]|nr:MAG: hypothetical protein IPK81_16920 [Rhodospirillales bacterium]
MHSDSAAWTLYSFTSFAFATGLMLLGIFNMSVDLWMRAYFLMGTFFLVGSSFTLAKTLRDRHEGRKLINKIDEAKTEQLLKQYDLRAPGA